jgi:uncharacterized flavoprotein (TIGR03862 family)
MNSSAASSSVAVIGGGPAGLMAAEVAARAGLQVDLYDAMPSVGRKFLLAGKGGLNLTHSEALPAFLGRYGDRRTEVERWLQAFSPDATRAFAASLGIETFVGSSGRVFPKDMKAAPLLRAWLQRLRAAGVRFHMRQRWIGWTDDGGLRLEGADGEHTVRADAVVLALGGGSWPRLGSDGSWAPWLAARGVEVKTLKPSNCGFDVAGWSEHLRSRHAGEPMKAVALSFDDFTQRGEFVVTETGIEGSLVYAASSRIRDAIEAHGSATVHVDLLPQRELAWVQAEVAHPRGSRSLSTHLKSRLGLHGVKTGLLNEVLSREAMGDSKQLAAAIKALPITLVRARPIAEAISTAGGVAFDALDDSLMLRAAPGVFCAGEMIDWEAPTGGYLLTACLASGHVAGQGVVKHFSLGK